MTVEYNTELLHHRAIDLKLGNMELARLAHLSPKTVKAAMSGSRVSRRSIARLIEVLGIDPSSIVRTFTTPPTTANDGRAGAAFNSRPKGGRPCTESA